jgi:hypothetical protein
VKTKIKVHCLAILDGVTTPLAVLVADLRVGQVTQRYVLLTDEQRAALSRMARAVGTGDGYGVRAVHAPGQTFPTLVRTHAFDAHGRLSEDMPVSTRPGIWSNAEPLWVSTELASVIVGDFYAWRQKNPARESQIWAPGWDVLLAVQALALAARLNEPLATDAADRDPEYDAEKVQRMAGIRY